MDANQAQRAPSFFCGAFLLFFLMTGLFVVPIWALKTIAPSIFEPTGIILALVSGPMYVNNMPALLPFSKYSRIRRYFAMRIVFVPSTFTIPWRTPSLFTKSLRPTNSLLPSLERTENLYGPGFVIDKNPLQRTAKLSFLVKPLQFPLVAPYVTRGTTLCTSAVLPFRSGIFS